MMMQAKLMDDGCDGVADMFSSAAFFLSDPNNSPKNRHPLEIHRFHHNGKQYRILHSTINRRLLSRLALNCEHTQPFCTPIFFVLV